MAYNKTKQKQYQLNHKEGLKVYKKQYDIDHPEKLRKYVLKKYGITPEQYNKLFIKQKGCCVICGVHQSECSRAFSIDHDHENGTIRGLLCMSCNLLLGHAKDNINILKKATDYLLAMNEKQSYEKNSNVTSSTIYDGFIQTTDSGKTILNNRENTIINN